ncbi:nuclear transport factor 2 family protein [Mycobacterium persicum]|uniref:SnoaL-like domain-containing protein n=1 Tax=Mycobacterium persicum TaxID=1487726 RepID=A0AB38UNX1_9MYCO|nr:nuclear transport factor 2 family protein [Mycobacterium persicum]ORB59051.1 polyketide cyclase [Mycobacterium persicum]ORB91057.1 polyketide cyclase [Mycobacterium persicum]VAZ82255.1 hypothetical protein LAUMK42_01062 [Mycobacterium persicum]
MVPTVQVLYDRWITELWAGRRIGAEIVAEDFVGHWPGRDIHGPAELEQIIDDTRTRFADLTFAVEIGPLCDGDWVAGRWVGAGHGPDGPVAFTGNDIVRLSADRQRFAEYWAGTSTG